MAPEERDQRDETREEAKAPGSQAPAGDAPEELRYEGPITIDDEEDEYLDEGGGSGKVYLTAAVLSALVLVIIATAMWMRSGTEKKVEAREFAAMEPPPPVTEQAAGEATAPANPGEIDYRALPDAAQQQAAAEPPVLPPVDEPAPKAAPNPPAIERPRPRAARDVQQAAGSSGTPAPAAETGAASLADVRRQVLSGRVAEAARTGEAWVRGRPATEWTLQVLVACSPDTVRRAFRNVIDPNLVLLPARVRGRACYRVCWRTFPGEQAAKGAIAEVPGYFRRDAKPLARSWNELLP